MLTVEATFRIERAGIIVTGLLEADVPKFKTGDQVDILRPDGTSVCTVIKGLDIFGGYFSEKKIIGVLLGNEIMTKEQVPNGSVISLHATK